MRSERETAKHREKREGKKGVETKGQMDRNGQENTDWQKDTWLKK